jgi:glycosyltransferase involved in cell wall biosynthesis
LFRRKFVNTKDKLIPLVSIITPSYNQGAFLEETIQSVLKQDYTNIEYIVIDGGSTDNSLEIINRYEDKLTYWVSEKDEGQTHAIIKGFDKARGKYITWLCSDDLIEPSMVSISVTYLENNPELVMTYGDRIRYDARSNIIGYHRYCEFRPWLLKWGFAIPQETCLIRRIAYESCGGLDKDLFMAMDFDLFFKLSKVGKIKHLPVFLGRFRSHTHNKSTVFNNEISQNGFYEGYPLELAKLYYKHYKKPFPLKKWRKVSLLNEIVGLFDRRRKGHKVEKNQILEIQR